MQGSVIDHDGLVVGGTAMHHAVRHGLKVRRQPVLAKQGLQVLQGGFKHIASICDQDLLVLRTVTKITASRALPPPAQGGVALGLKTGKASRHAGALHLAFLERVERKFEG